MMKISFGEFRENNIQFRVISSKLMERYKSSQSFVLSEMIHGEYRFSKTSREIALLLLDVAFNWIIMLENYIIRDSGKTFGPKSVKYALATMQEMDNYRVNIMFKNEDIFDKKIAEPWNENHTRKMTYLRDIVVEAEGFSDIEAFAMIVNLIIEMADTIKFELYEIDYLANGGRKPFLCLTDLSVVMFHERKILPMINRAKIYKKYFNTGNEFILKNYSQEPNPISYISKLESEGIQIKNKYNTISA